MKNNPLNHIFSVKAMEAFASGEATSSFRESVRRYIPNPNDISNGDALSFLRKYMSEQYRNEHVFKDVLFHSLVLPRLKTNDDIAAFCEMPMGESIADFVLIDDVSSVYEIKTDLDGFSRLESQVNDYRKAFRFVNVVCSHEKRNETLQRLGSTQVGVMTLDADEELTVCKEAEECDVAIARAVQFDLLRKGEKIQLVESFGREIPQVGASKWYRACYAEFASIEDSAFQEAFEQLIKKRRENLDVDALLSYPREFQLMAYLHGAKPAQAESLRRFYDMPFAF